MELKGNKTGMALRYQFPLNERTRMLLRVEDVLSRARQCSDEDSPDSHRNAIVALCELVDLSTRVDIKNELRLDLERQRTITRTLRGNPGVNEGALERCLIDLDHTLHAIERSSGRAGNRCRDDEWLNVLRTRATIPGGMTRFDIPSFNYWCSLDSATRRERLRLWLADFEEVRLAVDLVLRMLRDSGGSQSHIAAGGYFQLSVEGKAPQLALVDTSPDCECVPEVSANRFVFTLRFMRFDMSSRPRPCDSDIAFGLSLCSL